MARILLVEDDKVNRGFYEMLLKQEGHTVEIALNGEEGLSKILEGGYDLVLLDIILPKKDGLTILKELKKTPPKQPNKKIVMLTAMDQNEFIKSALSTGADGYLMKATLNPNDLLGEIRAFLSQNNVNHH
ncbi:MAG: response regulator [Candidatus Gottesmanbacteria bacterium]